MAVPLPGPAVEAIGELVSAVQADVEAAVHGARSQVRWVRLDGLHLTLRFLGPTAESRVEEIAALVDRAAARAAPIQVTVAGTGAVPVRRPGRGPSGSG